MKEIAWKTGDGREVIFTVALKTERIVGRDDIAGDITKPCCEIGYSATVAEVDQCGIGGITKIDPVKAGTVTVVAVFGKLGIAEENYDRIMAAVEDIKACDYWRAWQAKAEAADAVDREYQEHTKRVSKMMNP